ALVAVRDNERAAASLGVNVTVAKLYAFGVASVLAGLAGGLTALREPRVDFTAYVPLSSITVLLNTVIGGVGFIGGGVMGGANASGAFAQTMFSRIFTISDWFLFIVAMMSVAVVVQKQDGIAVDFVVIGRLFRRARGWVVARVPVL